MFDKSLTAGLQSLLGGNQEKNLSPSSNSRYKLSTSYSRSSSPPHVYSPHSDILLFTRIFYFFKFPALWKAYTAFPAPMSSHLVPIGWARHHGWLYADVERKAWWQQPCKQCLPYQVGSSSENDVAIWSRGHCLS